MDLLVEDSVVVEIKAVSDLLPVHAAQLTTYLRLSNKRVGLLINLDVAVLKKGIRRVVNHYEGPPLKSPLLRVSTLKEEVHECYSVS
jgi:PD-(D/E)XK nuclease superfamily